MNNGNLLTVVLDSEIESETSNTFSLGTGNDLERLNNTGNRLKRKSGLKKKRANIKAVLK